MSDASDVSDVAATATNKGDISVIITGADGKRVPYLGCPFRPSENDLPPPAGLRAGNQRFGVVWELLAGLEQLWFFWHATHRLPLVGLT